jgi:hypothetical protein
LISLNNKGDREDMSKKSELIQLFKEFKDRYSTIQARIAEVQKSDAYTDIGREQTIGKILEEFKPTVQLYHDKAIAAIDNGLAALQAKWKTNSAGRLADAGYQIGLGNVIKMIEAGAMTGTICRISLKPTKTITMH